MYIICSTRFNAYAYYKLACCHKARRLHSRAWYAVINILFALLKGPQGASQGAHLPSALCHALDHVKAALCP